MAKRVNWWSIGVDMDVTILERFHVAIETSRKAAVRSAKKLAKQWEAGGTAAPDFVYDDVADERHWARETANAMYPALAVAVSACAENTLSEVNARAKLKYARARPDWGDYVGSFEKKFQVKVERFPGYAGVRRARVLANAYKHRDGRCNATDCAILGGKIGQRIDYRNQPWDTILADLRELLTAVVDTPPDRLPPWAK